MFTFPSAFFQKWYGLPPEQFEVHLSLINNKIIIMIMSDQIRASTKGFVDIHHEEQGRYLIFILDEKAS
jgi:hypothetical protein